MALKLKMFHSTRISGHVIWEGLFCLGHVDLEGHAIDSKWKIIENKSFLTNYGKLIHNLMRLGRMR